MLWTELGGEPGQTPNAYVLRGRTFSLWVKWIEGVWHWHCKEAGCEPKMLVATSVVAAKRAAVRELYRHCNAVGSEVTAAMEKFGRE